MREKSNKKILLRNEQYTIQSTERGKGARREMKKMREDNKILAPKSLLLVQNARG